MFFIINNKELVALKRLKGFTLAEVLITLGIIGVVASLTIPTIMQKNQEKATVTALKKNYSNLSQAYTLAVQENGTPDTWNLVATQDPAGAVNLLNVMAPYMRITKKCDNTSGCFPDETYIRLDNSLHHNLNTLGSIAKGQLSDGSLFAFEINDPNCLANRGDSLLLQTVCASFHVDLNGAKKPNTLGKDLFRFYISKYGVVPGGAQSVPLADQFSFDADCKDKSLDRGYGCTAWVIYNENMDYLHCNNLSWDGPTKCP